SYASRTTRWHRAAVARRNRSATGAAAIGAANGADESPRRIRCCVLLAPTPGMGRKRILHLAARRRNLLRLECGLANTGRTRAENPIDCPTSHEILPRRRQSPVAGKLQNR